MRFNKRLDLNLLIALDFLLTERSISRAAERMSLTPSALSSSLGRLREYFNDELLVQVGRKMELTPRATGLHDVVRDVLVRIDSSIATQPQFDPKLSDRVFRIFMSDYTQIVLAPHMLSLASEVGCTAQFDFLPQVTNPQRSLERGDADLLVIPRGFVSPDHPDAVLFEEDFTAVVWQDGPFGHGELTFDQYIGAGHVVMRPSSGVGESYDAWFLGRYGVSRKVAVTTYGFAALPALVCGTSLIATVHSRLARLATRGWPLALKPPPVPIERMVQTMQWHKYRTEDPGLAWLRDLLHRASVRMDEPSSIDPVLKGSASQQRRHTRERAST